MRIVSVGVTGLALLALPGIARAQASCDQLREAERVARQRLQDCTRRGGGCVEEFRARDETVAAAADCPAATPTPTPEATAPAESLPTPAATATPATTPSPAAFPTASAVREHRGDHGHRVSVTVSLIGLLVDPTLVEITGEYALSRKLGVAFTGGYANGTDTLEDEETGETDTYHTRIIEAGGSARYSLFGTYDHGMQVGGRAHYLDFEFEDLGLEEFGESVNGKASGVSVGPFIGYKKTARFGLTFEAQLGVQYSAFRIRFSDDSGNSAASGIIGFGPIINLNLGWAF